MLSRNQEKLLRKLSQRKHRWKEQMFIAEGRKVVTELIQEGVRPEFLLATSTTEWAGMNTILLPEQEFQLWSSLSKADDVLGVFHFPEPASGSEELVVVIDGVKDPGNLGTIIRTCDWFGVQKIYCCNGTADVFNPKTVQSTMGSIARVSVVYEEPHEIFLHLQDYRLYGAEMAGEPFTEVKIAGRTALIVGSESHGLSSFWSNKAHRITIPKKSHSKVESLNVAVATAVILSHFAHIKS